MVVDFGLLFMEGLFLLMTIVDKGTRLDVVRYYKFKVFIYFLAHFNDYNQLTLTQKPRW